ncbi:hypothetical protein ACR9GP_24255 [Enterobacter ludwigii]
MPGEVLGITKMLGGMFVTVIDAYQPQRCMISIATNEAKSATSSLLGRIFGPAMQALQLTEDFTNAPCQAIYGNTLFLFCPDGETLKYATYSGTGWSTSSSTVPGANPACGASAVTFNGLLYVFYQSGAGNSATGGLWYNVFNGNSWSQPAQVPDVVMANSSSSCSPSVTNSIDNIPVPARYASAPSAVVFNTELYVFYQGPNMSGGQLCYIIFNGTSWNTPSIASNADICCSPSAVVYQNNIYVFYQGAGFNEELWYALFNGSNWSNTQVSVSYGINASPQAAVWEDDIVVVHQQGGTGDLVCYITYDGSTWSADTELTPIALSNSPGPFVYNDELYVAMQDQHESGQLWYTGSDGSHWTLMEQISGAGMSASPAPVEFNGDLYCFYQGSGNNGDLYYSKAVTDWSWSSPTAVNPIELSASPAAIVLNGQPVCLFQNDTVLFCTLYDTNMNGWLQPFPLPVSLTGTASAVTFTSPGSADAELYIFYQSAQTGALSGELWYIVGDPSTGIFSSPAQIAEVTMLGSPSAVIFDSQLYVFYQSSGELCCSVSADGTTWTAQTTGAEMTESPSAVVYTSPGTTTPDIYVFYQGTTQWIYQSVFDGTSWVNSQVPNTGISYSPSATVYNNMIYILHAGQSNTDTLWYNIYTGSAWDGDVQVDNVGISGSPAAVVANNQLYVFHEGDSDNEQLWYSILTSNGWEPDTLLQPYTSPSGPSVVNYNSILYNFYETNGQLCYSINAGGASFWTTQMLVPGVMLSGPPSALLFNNVFYVFYQSAAGGEIWYVTCDGGNSEWSSPAQIPGATPIIPTSNTFSYPAAVVFNNQIYVFYQTPNWTMSYNSFNGSTWSTTSIVPNMGLSCSPSPIVYDGQLYVFYQGENYSGGLYYSTLETGGGWSGSTQITGVATASPSAVILNDQLYIFFQGGGNCQQLWYSTLQGGSWVQEQVPNVSTVVGSPSAVVLDNYSVWVLYGNTSGTFSNVCWSGQLSWSGKTGVVPSGSTSPIMSAAPSPVVYDDKLYVFFQGARNDSNVAYTWSSDGNSWATCAGPSTTHMSGSPSTVVFNNNLYLFHMGEGQKGQLWCNVMSSGSWRGDTQILLNNGSADMYGGGADTSMGPSAVVFNDKIYCFYNGGAATNNGWCNCLILTENDTLSGGSHSITDYYDITLSSGQNLTMSLQPAAVVYDGQIFLFYQQQGNYESEGTGQLMYICSSTGNAGSWSDPTQVGMMPAAITGGILPVALSFLTTQGQDVAEPLVSTFLLPSNLAHTAVLTEDSNHKLHWTLPTFTL